MAFEIDTFEPLEFNIPGPKGKIITITAPPMDCIDPDDLKKMNKQLEEYKHPEVEDTVADVDNPAKNGAALVRFMLKYYNTTKEKQAAIDKLVPRQISQIDEIWGANSNVVREDGEDATAMEAMGESEPSTNESSETDK